MRLLFVVAAVTLGTSAALAAPAAPADRAAIVALIVDFDVAIASKNPAAMAALFYERKIVWRATPKPATQAAVRRATGKDRPYAEDTGAHLFLADPQFAKIALRERFGPPAIDSDGQLASVNFNYALTMDDKVSNWGRETWQLVKVGADWRILGLLFSYEDARVAAMPANHLATP